MTLERLFNSFIPPKKNLYPPKQISGYAPAWEQTIITYAVVLKINLCRRIKQNNLMSLVDRYCK